MRRIFGREVVVVFAFEGDAGMDLPAPAPAEMIPSFPKYI